MEVGNCGAQHFTVHGGCTIYKKEKTLMSMAGEDTGSYTHARKFIGGGALSIYFSVFSNIIAQIQLIEAIARFGVMVCVQ